MITLKNQQQIQYMRDAGRIAAGALKVAGEQMQPGVTTYHIDQQIYQYIVSMGAKPSFLGYQGFPASACISINDELIHGIPSKRRKLQLGDIVSVDVGAQYEGYHGDNAYTYAVGQITAEASNLLQVTQECLYEGIKMAQVGNRMGDIGNAIASYAQQFGYGVVTKFVGHGIGRELHEKPEVPNVGIAGRGLRLLAGMTIAIEPMVNLLGEDVITLEDGWTVVSKSRSLSAHFEHVIAIGPQGPEILTRCEECDSYDVQSKK